MSQSQSHILVELVRLEVGEWDGEDVVIEGVLVDV